MYRMKRLGAAAVALALSLSLGAFAQPASAANQVIKIGIELPISGNDASDGIPMEQAATLAIEQANAHAPKGFTFQADALDDTVNGIHNPQQGVANIRALAADPGVIGVVGPFNSNVAAAEIPVSNQALLPLVSPAATDPTLTQSPRYRPAHPDEFTFFRVSASNDKQAHAAAYSCKQLGLKSIYVIDDNETFGTGLANIFTDAAKSLSLTILGRDHLTVNQQDFRPLLTRIAQMHPDAIYYGGVTSTGGALLRKQMADSGFDTAKTPFVASDGIYDQAFVKIAGPQADDTYFTAAAPNITKLVSAREFISAYQERYHTAPTAFAANAFVAAQVIINATVKAIQSNHGDRPSRAEVLKQLRATKEFHSIVGTFGFDASGDTTNPSMALWKIEHGTPSYLHAIDMRAVKKVVKS
ncbi:branched-chain amino acid ABC transporter substrate-binding protein [bacterium]|nr:MAG: branched-chain amino acid ABC transporter substrate-binding protein [bacterium]